MPNPTINFRLSKYHIARGLQILMTIEPNFKPTSVSQVIKTCYFDYVAKMTIGKVDTVEPQYLEMVDDLIGRPKSGKGLADLVSEIDLTHRELEVTKDLGEKSIKSSVNDFSPPKDWEE